jgi:hypothetical protein
MDGHFQLINFIIDSNQCDYLDDLLTKQKFYKGTFDSEIIEIANRLYAMGLEEKYKLICDKCFERLSEIEDPKYRLISEFGLCLRFPEHQGKAKVLELQLRASFAQYPTEQKLELAELLIKFYISNKQLTQVLELIDDLPNENGHALQGGISQGYVCR